MRPKDRAIFLSELYTRALRDQAGAKYVWNFSMADANDNLLYWLFFCTNNIRGLEEIKRSMRTVADDGSYRFSDATDPDQLKLLSGFDDEWLADHLALHFAGQRVEIGELREYILTETPCHRYATAVKILERRNKISAKSRPKIAYSQDFSEWIEFADRDS